MLYLIMCGGTYANWKYPKQLSMIHGEPLVARTIRLLRENGVDDIGISTNDSTFAQFGVTLYKHPNEYNNKDKNGLWVNCFYPTSRPTCYLMGDVVYSPNAIKTIVETETDDIEFFASAPPFSKQYSKKWAEPFAFKVQTVYRFEACIQTVKDAHLIYHAFKRPPIAWELWQVIKGTPLNKIDYTNYTVINDYTCDIDEPSDIYKFEGGEEWHTI